MDKYPNKVEFVFFAKIEVLNQDVHALQNVLIVSEFSDVFSKEFSGLQPEREVEISIIELQLGISTIYKYPYRMTSKEL
ncbi:hypothetical protein KFK09_002348 [Dendrobium nobile]|uniref:Uncharacterized protein n=1 Tax=Dendrobium nobile TaxID=94219 RepID=A0A8T3C129_DENNO|nr:hypothetical protein KFK09_002348 [Dendrobium nobile]